MLCGLGMQQCAMHNATDQKTTFLELGVNMLDPFELNLMRQLSFCFDVLMFSLFLYIYRKQWTF